MKRIKRMIWHTIIEIIIVIAMVFISIPVWQSFDLSQYETIAEQGKVNSNIDFEVSKYNSNMLFQASDDIALENIEPINIKLSNFHSFEESYSIYFIVSKNSTLDYQSIKIHYLEKTLKLKELTMLEDEEYYYFELTSGTILNNIVEFDLQIWIDIENNYDIADKSFSFDIINITGQEILV